MRTVIARRNLSDGTIEIRPAVPAHAQGLFDAASSSVAEVQPWLPWCHPGYTIEESREWTAGQQTAWDQGEQYSFHIFRKGRLVGGCGLNEIDWMHRCANLGYWVRTDATRRGIATRATRLIARFGFEDLGLGRCEIVVAVTNLPSVRVAARAGARQEGVMRNRLWLAGKHHDAIVFSLVPEDLGLTLD